MKVSLDPPAALHAFLEQRDGRVAARRRYVIGALFCLLTAIVASAIVASIDMILDLPLAASAVVLIVTLSGLAAILPALWISMRYLHRRPFATLFGRDGAARWDRFALGAAAATAASGATLAIGAGFGALDAAPWPPLSLVILLAALVALQATAEEAFFRGYLLQACAPLLRLSPILWAAPSLLLFTALHYTPGAPISALLWPLAFGAAATVLVWRSGGLATATGFHVGHNLVAILATSSEQGLAGVGPIRLPTDALSDALVWISLIGLAATLALLRRLVGERAA